MFKEPAASQLEHHLISTSREWLEAWNWLGSDSSSAWPVHGLHARTRRGGLPCCCCAAAHLRVLAGAQIIGKAKVPIIKFKETASSLNFDVSFNAANGPQAAEYVQDLMQRLPPMRSLILVLKVFLHQRELNEVRTELAESELMARWYTSRFASSALLAPHDLLAWRCWRCLLAAHCPCSLLCQLNASSVACLNTDLALPCIIRL